MKNKVFCLARILALVFLAVNILAPLIGLFLHIDGADVKEVICKPQFLTMVINSVIVTLSATIISVSLAFLLAWSLNRTAVKYKNVFSILFTIPMLIPSISHGIGLVLLLGEEGLITRLFHINIHLYGYPGLIIGSVLYSFPPAFLLLMDIFQYEDFTIYEAADVLGIGKRRQFYLITLPNIRKTLISAIFATFTLIFTDYGVPIAVGGKVMTMSLYMYREVVGLLNFSKGTIIGSLLLIPAVIAFIIDLKNEEAANTSTVTQSFQIKENKKRDISAYILCITIVILICLPISAFLYLSFVRQYPVDTSFSLKNIAESLSLGVGRYLENSIAIALSTSFVGTSTSFLIAYLTARTGKNLSNRFLHLISLVTMAVPGIVLGLSYVLFFNGSLIYGTLMLLILVNTIHFFASPYLLAYNSLSKYNSNLEDVSVTLGISCWRMIWDVYIPCTQKTILEMFAYFFVNSMVTISAVSFLASLKNMPAALMIPMFDNQALLESAAFISILILCINGIMKLAVYKLKSRLEKP
ncbi:MAG: ABC transporter permease subunit [Clostridiales bacterium]|nr:ABC transporter permease subunit [Clostridiales bacterium]